ncbi:MAG: hypothetical protein K2I72_01635, partial [Bacilli bacterium]|nr:hypothetical protein [Bacilli bacterium]
TYQCTWNDHINALEFGLELASESLAEIRKLIAGANMVSDDRSYPRIDYRETIATKVLCEELLKVAGLKEEPTNKRNYKGKRIYNLSCDLRRALEQFPRTVEDKEKPDSLNGLVKSLQIFKLESREISTDFYETGGDLYSDIRKIVLKKESPLYKKFYAGKVASILKEGNNETENFLAEDYELEQLVTLIEGTPDFYCRRRNDWSVKKAIIDERINKGFYCSHLKVLVKND